jgi:hypothetical protein
MPLIPIPRLLLRSSLSLVWGAGCLSVSILLEPRLEGVLPILQLLLEVIRSRKLPVDGRCVVGAVGFLVSIRLPILHRLLELMRLSERPVDGLRWSTTDDGRLTSLVPRASPGFSLLLNRLPMAQLLLEVMRSRKLPVDGR